MELDTKTQNALEWQLAAVESRREEAISSIRNASRKLMVCMMEVQYDPECDGIDMGTNFVTELREARAALDAATEARTQLREVFMALGLVVTDRMVEMKASGMHKHKPNVFERLQAIVHTSKDSVEVAHAHQAMRGDSESFPKVLKRLGVIPWND